MSQNTKTPTPDGNKSQRAPTNGVNGPSIQAHLQAQLQNANTQTRPQEQLQSANTRASLASLVLQSSGSTNPSASLLSHLLLQQTPPAAAPPARTQQGAAIPNAVHQPSARAAADPPGHAAVTSLANEEAKKKSPPANNIGVPNEASLTLAAGQQPQLLGNTTISAQSLAAVAAAVLQPQQPQPPTWNDRYIELAAFRQTTGHANPITGPLATWLALQRLLYHQGLHLSSLQVQLLRALGCSGFEENPFVLPAPTQALTIPNLTAQSLRTPAAAALAATAAPSVAQAEPAKPAAIAQPTKPLAIPLRDRNRGHGSWDDRFKQLKAYNVQHGNPNPPQTKGSPQADYKLAIWLNSQRQKYRKGTLDEDKLQNLLDLGCEGFGTNPNAPADQPPLRRKKVSWHERYLELKAFKERIGHANPHYGNGTEDSCQHLAQWLSNQRSDFRLRKKISMEQVKLLRALGCKGFGDEPSQEEQPQEASVLS